MLSPDRTNRMTCSACGWSRIVDHAREYRGSHTVTEIVDEVEVSRECTEMLEFLELDTRAPDPLWFEIEDPAFVPTWE